MLPIRVTHDYSCIIRGNITFRVKWRNKSIKYDLYVLKMRIEVTFSGEALVTGALKTGGERIG